MGLDMYSGRIRTAPEKPVDFEIAEADLIDSDMHYWRKHPNLHGWMEALYREKGGTASSFNCVSLHLTAEDLDRLETDITSRDLPSTSGFFFGASDGSEVEDDLQFIAKAREAISNGEAVYYTSWW